MRLVGKIWMVVIILITVGLCVDSALALSGSGTQEEPWLIQSLGDFDEFVGDANYWDDYTRLETDVNLAGRVYDRAVIAPDEDDVEDWFQGTAFTGVFDGNDHTISNFTCDSNGIDYMGMFGYVDDPNAEIRNLGLIDPNIDVGAGFGVGSLVGYLSHGDISNCYMEGGSVTGDRYVGGQAGGGSYGGTIADCYATGSVRGDISVGGLVGWNSAGSLSNCYSTGDVSGTGYGVGGLVGENGLFYYGDVPGDISNSYSIGAVQGVSGVGGLVGVYSVGDIERSFWDIETSGEPNMCDNPEDPNCDNSYGKRTAQLQQQSTFTDWDFINVWNIGENQTYPYLRTVPAGDINKDRIVNFLDLCIVAEEWMKEE